MITNGATAVMADLAAFIAGKGSDTVDTNDERVTQFIFCINNGG